MSLNCTGPLLIQLASISAGSASTDKYRLKIEYLGDAKPTDMKGQLFI